MEQVQECRGDFFERVVYYAMRFISAVSALAILVCPLLGHYYVGLGWGWCVISTLIVFVIFYVLYILFLVIIESADVDFLG